ncbi:MAG: hypothetical protein HY547_06365 [Elusimicrobia bacterium]|nr:hypothetical protein [Elusimicrobiota bacterium]
MIRSPKSKKIKIFCVFLFLLTLDLGPWTLDCALGAFDESLPGARPQAMSGAFTAMADDANAIFSNPAALGWIEHQEFTSGYSRLYLGLWDNSNLGTGYLAMTQPIHSRRRHSGSLGLAWMNFSLSQYYSEDTWVLAYGKKLFPQAIPGLHVGAGLKRLHHAYLLGSDPTAASNPYFTEHGTQQTAWGMDAGLFYHSAHGWSWGYSGSNVNSPVIGLDSDESLVPRHSWGAAIHRPNGHVALDAVIEGPYQKIAAGAERWISQGHFALRTGMTIGNRDLRQASFGFGLRNAAFSLDYAMKLPLGGLAINVLTHRVSFSVPFGEQLKKPLSPMIAEPLTAEEMSALQEAFRNARQQLTYRKARIQELEKTFEQLKIKLPPSSLPSERDVLTSGTRIEDDEIEALQDALGWVERELNETKKQADAERARLSALEKEMEKTKQKTPPKPKAAGRMFTHLVEDGDTLESLAKEYYGNRRLWMKIFRANENRLKRGGDPEAGHILIIPAIEEQ